MTKEQLVSRLRMLAAGHPSADCTFTAAAVEIEALQARVAELEYLDTQRLSSLRQVEAERNAAQGVIETITKDQTWFELKAERDALQARCAELEDELGSSTTYTLNELQAKVCGLAGERDRLKSELAEIHKQEPVSHRYRFTHPISGEPVWRDSSSTWNGQCVQEVQQLFAAPIPPVREPLSDNAILGIYNKVGQEDGAPYRFAGAIEAAIAQPAQVPAGSIRLWDAQWVSIMNHDNAYNGWSTNDAVNHAVRMTERYIAANVAQNNLPPLPAAQEVK